MFRNIQEHELASAVRRHYLSEMGIQRDKIKTLYTKRYIFETIKDDPNSVFTIEIPDQDRDLLRALPPKPAYS